ncbi:hypothetical protein D3C81_1857450 [compost metagenome]
MHLLRDLAGALGQIAEQSVDFCRRIRRAFGQCAHLIGDHGKTTALLTGARCFDGGVERQQVGLLGDGADGAEDRLDIVAVTLQLLHRLRRLLQLLA